MISNSSPDGSPSSFIGYVITWAFSLGPLSPLDVKEMHEMFRQPLTPAKLQNAQGRCCRGLQSVSKSTGVAFDVGTAVENGEPIQVADKRLKQRVVNPNARRSTVFVAHKRLSNKPGIMIQLSDRRLLTTPCVKCHDTKTRSSSEFPRLGETVI